MTGLWKRFWGLNWWVKSTAIIVGIIVISGIIGAASNGDGEDEDQMSRPILQAEETEAVRIRTPSPPATRKPMPTPRPTTPPYQLALISAACTRTAGSFIECEGFVENISGKILEDLIEVVIVWVDDAGTPLASDSSFVDYRPLFVKQQSPWTVFATWNPAFTNWRVEFSEFLGGTISMKDDR